MARLLARMANATSASPSSSSTASSKASASPASVGSDASDASDPGTAMRNQFLTVLRDRTGEGETVTKTFSSMPADTCTWYGNAECALPRSCFDCLNVLLPGQDCMIDQYGTCTSMRDYSPDKDFRRLLPPNVIQPGMNNFPAANTSYCAADDQYCATCRDAWANPFDSSTLSYLRFCRGQGGCVCIQSCEVMTRTENILAQRCMLVNRPSARTVYTSVAIMAGLCFIFMLAAMIVRVFVNRMDSRRSGGLFRREPPLPQREPSGPQLNLSGWRSMREKLIETERVRLEDTGETTLTAPVIDNTPGPAVEIEEGDGYRPASPSELGRRDHRADSDTRTNVQHSSHASA